jgi:glycosyltransferase involved in cell wall biosynthesis
MRIVQIIYSLELGGAEKFVVDLSNELSKNHEVYLLTYKDDNIKSNRFHFPDLSPRVSYTNLNLQPGFKLSDVKKLNKQLKKIDPDIVHCHLGVIFHVFLYTLLHRSKNFFHTIHSDAKVDSNKGLASFIRRFFYKKLIFKPITISEKSQQSFNEFYKLKNSHLIYNGRQKPEKTAAFEATKTEIENYKQNHNDLVFIHIGRQDLVLKNQLMLIKVFNRLVNENNNLILLIIGNDYDKPEASILKKIAGNGIYFCGSKQNIADYLLNADAFCLSSKFEGMPISLLEALACECVPICTPVGGIPNLITNNSNGFLSKNTEEDSYYDAVKSYLYNIEAIDKKQLSSFFEANFTIEKCAFEHEKIYQA